MSQELLELAAEFDAENPRVYELFSRYTLQAVSAGRTKMGAKMVFERIRWYAVVETTDPDFKLNNNHTAFYARKFMSLNPTLGEIFETRERFNAVVAPPCEICGGDGLVCMYCNSRGDDCCCNFDDAVDLVSCRDCGE